MVSDHSRKRRRWQFSIRFLLLLMVPSALLFGWIGARMQRARFRAEFEAQFSGYPWFVWQDGELIEIDLDAENRDPAILNAEISHLDGLSHLQVLVVLGPSRINDDSMVTIGKLTSLYGLLFKDVEISKGGLIHLKTLASLHTLALFGKTFTDNDLLSLPPLSSLKRLELRETNATDAGLVSLRALPSLESLELNRMNITGAGLVNLRGLPALKTFWLHHCRITDDGLIHLHSLPVLETLELVDVGSITDAGLAHLVECPSLKYVLLQDNPHITEEGVQRCRERMPNTKIHYCPSIAKETENGTCP